jgi:hypothetical protein
VQAFAMAIAGGATRVSVFKVIDTPTDLVANPEPFGLIRADGSRRPAFDAYRVATTYMAGFRSGQLDQRPDVTIVAIPRSTGTTTVLWTRTPWPVTVQIPTHTGSATLVDVWGNRRTISASGGAYTVPLPGAICTHGPPCLIGGSPYLIVEGNSDAIAPPLAQPTPVPLLTTDEEDQKPSNKDVPQNATANLYAPSVPTSLPEDTIIRRFMQTIDSLFLWRKRALPGYQIGLVLGPPYLYWFSIAYGAVTEAQRNVNAIPIRGLFDQLAGLYHGDLSVPICATQVTVQLKGGWTFPIRFVDHRGDDCRVGVMLPWQISPALGTTSFNKERE